MSTIVTRAGKGSALTHNEVDANFVNLNTDKLQSGNTAAALTITSATINGGTFSGSSITNTSLTSGRVTYASTGGLLADSANLAWTGTALNINTGYVGIVNGTGSTTNRTGVYLEGLGGSTGHVSPSVEFSGANTNAAIWSARSGGGYGGELIFATQPTSSGAYPSERMRLDSSGNLGLGVTPSAWLAASKVFEMPTASFYNAGESGLVNNLILNTASRWVTKVTGVSARYTQVGANHKWFCNVSASAGTEPSNAVTEAMTLDSSGNLTLGKAGGGELRFTASGNAITSPGTNGAGHVTTNSANGIMLIGQGSSYDIAFLNRNATTAGYVATGATTITTSSDERLKENFEPITDALFKISKLRKLTGNYKSDPSRNVAFFIAQDMVSAFPQAAETTNLDELGINYNYAIPLVAAGIDELTAAIQEQQAMIDELKAKVAALEAA